jgi:multidrug efflux pump subunit AcrA (membrane-fusion protein)
MSTTPKVVAWVVIVTSIAALVLVKQQQIRGLMAENAALRAELSQMTFLQDTNARLAEQLKATAETSQANQNELLRLRGQGSRLRQLEQENTQLKAQRQQFDRQMQQAQLAVVSSEQPQLTPASDVKVTSGNPNLNTTDLGMLELSDGTATRFDLGGGTNCVVTPTALSDGNAAMEIKVGVTNADGTVSELGTSRLTARPGQHCSISVGDRMIALAVKLKTQ